MALAACLLALSGAPAMAACGGAGLPAAPATLQRSELFFGMSLPGGRLVSPRAWARFEREILGPKLCGYTAIDARGGWLGGGGRLIHEPAKLVVVIHLPGNLAEIEAVADEWLRRFGQEAVLRATQPIDGGLIGARTK
jgi:hypothetical protein